jgi:hypothetical protein
VTLTCHFSQSSSALGNCTVDSDVRSFYNSVSDFVDEIPGRPLATRGTTTFTPRPMSCTQGTEVLETTYTHAGRRLVGSGGQSSVGSPIRTYVYGSWDAQDRFTSATLHVPGLPDTNLSCTWNDATHTAVGTMTFPGTTQVSTHTFDADWIPISSRSDNPPGGTIITFTTLAREQIFQSRRCP